MVMAILMNIELGFDVSGATIFSCVFGELDALLKEPGEPSMPAIAALHERFNMKLMGPPLSAEG
jgi:hypothetical protein